MGLKLKCLWKNLVRCTDSIHEHEKTSTCEFSLLFYHLLHLQSEIPLVLWPVLLTDTGTSFPCPVSFISRGCAALEVCGGKQLQIFLPSADGHAICFSSDAISGQSYHSCCSLKYVCIYSKAMFLK